MKPLEQFLKQMMASAQRVGANDAAGATEIIQRALKDAGLMAPGAPGTGAGLGTGTTASADAPPRFVDLNSAPDWAASAPAGVRSRLRRFLAGAGAQARAPVAREDLGGGQFIDGVFTCAAGTRRYKLYVPATGARADRPLVVMLHGCTQNAGDFAAGTGMNVAADERDCLVLYPEQDRSANPNACWNWFDAAQQSRDLGEPAILAGMTRQVMEEHGADPKRVFVAGLSAGGAMAAILGAEYPELFAAIGVHSGLAAGSGSDMISGLQAMKRPRRAASLDKGVPIIVFHGDADAVVHPDNGSAVLRQFVDAHAAGHRRDVREQSEREHAAGRDYTRTTWRHADGRRVAEHWLVHGAAHAWQGGKPSGSHTDPSGPSASKAMLAFFLDCA